MSVALRTGVFGDYGTVPQKVETTERVFGPTTHVTPSVDWACLRRAAGAGTAIEKLT
jgi:hypothetical protein